MVARRIKILYQMITLSLTDNINCNSFDIRVLANDLIDSTIILARILKHGTNVMPRRVSLKRPLGAVQRIYCVGGSFISPLRHDAIYATYSSRLLLHLFFNFDFSFQYCGDFAFHESPRNIGSD